MKVIILAGGLGTRISEETENKPKPMVLIDDKPILWHIMNIFGTQGFDDFVLALGYRSEIVKRWLIDLNELDGDITVDVHSKQVKHLSKVSSSTWNVTALETGLNSQTGGRIARCMKTLPNQRVLVTYGDGLANVSIKRLLEFHESHGKLATVTSVHPPARFGHLHSEDGLVTSFGEKNQSDTGWINGGFFVLEPQVLDYIESDLDSFEASVLPKLVQQRQLMTFQHDGFWQPMDTLREKRDLSALALQTPPPWMQFD